MVKLLLSHNADINATDSRGRTPLHLAFRKGHTMVAKSLSDANADNSVTDKYGFTPAQVAEEQGIDLSNFTFNRQ